LVSLCGAFAVLQAPCFESLLLDPFSWSQNGFVSAEADIGWRDVVQALMIALMVVVLDEGFDLGFKIAGQKVVFQQDAVFRVCV
jgi:hypothetical protein